MALEEELTRRGRGSDGFCSPRGISYSPRATDWHTCTTIMMRRRMTMIRMMMVVTITIRVTMMLAHLHNHDDDDDGDDDGFDNCNDNDNDVDGGDGDGKKSATQREFQAARGSYSLSAQRARQTKSRGSKGLHLEVGPRRGP